MAIETAAPIGHGRDRQNPDRDVSLAAKPSLQRDRQILACRDAEGSMKSLRRRLELGEEIGAGFEDFVNLVDRQPCSGDRRGVAFPGQQGRKIGKPRLLFAIGAIEFQDAGEDIGRSVGHLGELLLARKLPGQQGIGEHRLQFIEDLAAPALQIACIHLISLGQLQDQLNRQRSLIALDEIEIGGGDAEGLGHRRLGQPERVADAPDARAGEDLVLRHGSERAPPNDARSL